GPAAAAKLAVRLGAAKGTAKRGTVAVTVTGAAGTRGRVTLTAKAGGRTVTVGTASFTIGANGTVTVKVKLAAKPLAQLRRTGRLAVSARATAGSATATAKATLRR
ncbi:MAG TPA: hypothetical protein VN238_07725, partial [Solirubrobacteraceae bacterium]|nr:hypothetical protein [Solirubrobacteraceae bacterium]